MAVEARRDSDGARAILIISGHGENQKIAALTEPEDGPRDSRFGDDAPVVAQLTGDELGPRADIRQLARLASSWYRKNLVRDGKPITVKNRATGWEISFDNAGTKKIGGRKGEDVYRAVVALPAILEHGRPIASEPDRKGRDQIKAVHTFAATIMLDGRRLALLAHVRETTDGRFHYDLGVEGSEGRSRTALKTDSPREQAIRSAFKGAPADLNLATAGSEVNSSAISPAQARAINAAANQALAKVGLLGKIGLKVEAGRLTGPNGQFFRGVVSILRDRGKGWRHTLDHEIVHALRAPDRWGAPYGLFTREEWRALLRAARADDAISARVRQHYADESAAVQAEEMVAELYADWAQGRRDVKPGPLRRALDTIRSFSCPISPSVGATRSCCRRRCATARPITWSPIRASWKVMRSWASRRCDGKRAIRWVIWRH
ncbi:hypothetical protein [Paracoccus isoporae]|nr:hypothetical protein [Paracoccus isoporae]